MQKFTAGDPETKSADVIGDNVETLKGLFPDAFTEGKVDFEVLKQLLGGAVDESDEKYGLNWHGKRAARQLALTPSTGTLRPCPDESVNWDTTQNIMIEGDNLEVLKLLQKSYTGKVKLIYIDPPYNTGKDFVYPDNFRDGIDNYLRMTGQIDGGGRHITSNSDRSGRFHSSWLNMLYPRLLVARNMLAEDGAIFVSIDDGEVERLRGIMSEIFGEENFVAQIAWQNLDTTKNDAPLFSDNHEYIVGFAKQIRNFGIAGLEKGEKQRATYKNRDKDPRGDYLLTPLHAKSGTEAGRYTFTFSNGQSWTPPPGTYPRFSKATLERFDQEGRLFLDPQMVKAPQRKTYWSEVGDRMPPPTFWDYKTFGSTRQSNAELGVLVGKGVFQNPKPTKLIEALIDILGIDQGIVLDFFAGSGTTGHAVLRRNHQKSTDVSFILVQLPEPLDPDNSDQKTASELCDELGERRTIAELTKHRLRRAIAELDPSESNGSGFMTFKLDSSNIEVWEPSRDSLGGSLTNAIEHLKTNRNEQDILFELVLKLGLELTVSIETRAISGKVVYSVAAGTLLVCLAESLGQDDIEAVGLGITAWHEELDPAGDTTVVFRDSAFADDVAKTNLTAILEQHGLTTVRSL